MTADVTAMITADQRRSARVNQRRSAWLAAIVLVPRLAIIVVSWAAGQRPASFEYDALARNVLAGRGYVYPHLGTDYFAFHSAVPYVVLTAAVYRVCSEPQVAMLVVQSMIALVLAGLIWILGRWVGGPGVGWLSAALVAWHPGLIYYDTRNLHSLGLDALSLTAATLALWKALKDPSVRYYALAGGLSALAVLERGSFLPALAVFVPLLYRAARRRGIAMRSSMAFLCCAALFLGPWLVRNTMRYGRPLLMTTTGEHLWRGNNPNATGTSLTADGRPLIETASPQFREELSRNDELGQMRLFTDAAQAYIVQHPRQALAKMGRRVWYFLWHAPTTGQLYPAAYRRLYALYYSVMGVLAVVGVWRLRRRWLGGDQTALSAAMILGGVWASVGLTQSLFYVELRHRWGVEGFMLILSAVGIVSMAQLLADRVRSQKDAVVSSHDAAIRVG